MKKIFFTLFFLYNQPLIADTYTGYEKITTVKLLPPQNLISEKLKNEIIISEIKHVVFYSLDHKKHIYFSINQK